MFRGSWVSEPLHFLIAGDGLQWTRISDAVNHLLRRPPSRMMGGHGAQPDTPSWIYGVALRRRRHAGGPSSNAPLSQCCWFLIPVRTTGPMEDTDQTKHTFHSTDLKISSQGDNGGIDLVECAKFFLTAERRNTEKQ